MRCIVNKYAKSCANCTLKVAVAEGFAVCSDDNMWKTYCTTCCPIKKQEVNVRAEITENGDIYCPYSRENVAMLRSLPLARWNGQEKCWNVSLSPEHIQRVVEVCTRLGLKIDQSIIDKQKETVNTIISKIEPVVSRESLSGKQLLPFQIDGTAFLASKNRALLGDEMGTGKTVQTLCALDSSMGTIVVCPASLKYNWKKECAEWRPELSVRLIEGRGAFMMPKAGEVIIVNYDILPESFEEWSSHPDFQLVCDEVHACKSYKTKRHKAVKALANKATKVFGLTGTPLMNRPFDLFGVLSCLHLEKETFGSFGGFLRAFGGAKNRWGGYSFYGIAPEVPEKLRRVMLRRRREEVLPDLPKKSYTTLEVNGLSTELKVKMDKMGEDWLDIVEMGTLPPFEEFSALRASLAESRIPALLEIVAEHEEEEIPLVVFSAHKTPIEALGKREGWAIITGDVNPKQRQKIVEDFQDGKLKGIALTIQAGGTGLTLTHAWKTIFVDLDWTPALNAQAEDRTCRLGQTKPCEVVRLVSNHPLDIHINKLLASKIAMFHQAVDSFVEVKAVERKEVKGETEEEFNSRMEEAYRLSQEKAEKELAKLNPKLEGMAKVKVILESERKRCGGKIAEPVMTPKIEQQIKDGLEKMLQVCDGAVDKDYQGFNKPDALRSRFLYMAGLEEPETLLAAYYMLKRYPRQMRHLLD